jgi:hypothetical protein
MITNFEEITVNLTPEEKELTGTIIEILGTLKKSKPMLSSELVEMINKKHFVNSKYKFTGVKLRKYCNYIRSKSLLPIIATSNGYYVSYDKSEIALQIESLEQRSEAILNSVNGLKFYL